MEYLLASGYHIWSRHLRYSLHPMIVYCNIDLEINFQIEKSKVEPRISTIQVFLYDRNENNFYKLLFLVSFIRFETCSIRNIYVMRDTKDCMH